MLSFFSTLKSKKDPHTYDSPRAPYELIQPCICKYIRTYSGWKVSDSSTEAVSISILIRGAATRRRFTSRISRKRRKREGGDRQRDITRCDAIRCAPPNLLIIARRLCVNYFEITCLPAHSFCTRARKRERRDCRYLSFLAHVYPRLSAISTLLFRGGDRQSYR